ncbi:MAG TPA: helix-turn-helix domain-containing protein [Pyrinomonadaceae bacterium]|nr:helix-turn-helix domain-containing protein [Pyrinomonadaceae bacterium]
MSSNIFIKRICQYCDTEFTARTTVTKYCSHKCASRAYKDRKRGIEIKKSNEETEEALVAPILKIQTKDFLSVDEAAKLLGISRWTLSRAIQDKRLKAARFGDRIIIKRTDIDSLFT